MDLQSWIALLTFGSVIGTALVALAMRLATLSANVTNQCERIDDEAETRKEQVGRLQKAIDEEEAERKKRDSDLLGDFKKAEERFRRWERRQIETGKRPPRDTPPDDECEDGQ